MIVRVKVLRVYHVCAHAEIGDSGGEKNTLASLFQSSSPPCSALRMYDPASATRDPVGVVKQKYSVESTNDTSAVTPAEKRTLLQKYARVCS
jgi:hypothetical protein